MRIDEIVRMQTGFKQKSQKNGIGKEITEKIEFNVIEALMGKAKGKKGKNQKAPVNTTQVMQSSPAYNLSLSGPKTPMWDGFYTKREPAMSDEEFEKAIVALAIEYAEKAIEIGNSEKSASMINRELFNFGQEFTHGKYAALEVQYVSIVSPDRKAAYAKTDFTNNYSVYGDEKNIFGEDQLMRWNPYNGWSTWITPAEEKRIGKFTNIFMDTLKAYEKEHGVTIPSTTISKVVVPPRNYF
jgi:hypothetical protein